jgi:hypothetical protein
MRIMGGILSQWSLMESLNWAKLDCFYKSPTRLLQYGMDDERLDGCPDEEFEARLREIWAELQR